MKQLKVHLLNLLEAKRSYWRQRSTIRWVKLGDENTKLFHSIASHNFRRNHISPLLLPDGSLVVEHEQKVAILWNSYKEKIGWVRLSFGIFSLIWGI
jgi:hypothetical protein